MFLRKELDLARSMAMHAGEVAVGYSRQAFVPETKPDLSPVTAADKECERLIAQRIVDTFPDDGILGEEGASRPSKNGRIWIIDPIDGTRDFVRGLPLWAILIGLEIDGEIAMGVAHMAAQNAMYSAVRGEGAWLNEKPIHSSKIDKPENAVVCVTALNSCEVMPYGPKLLGWLRRFWAVRSMGGCYDALLVASGHAEVWVEPHAQPWDLAALKVILEEAGVRFRNLDGGCSHRGGSCVAYVPSLEPAVQELLAP